MKFPVNKDRLFIDHQRVWTFFNVSINVEFSFGIHAGFGAYSERLPATSQ